MNVKKIEVVYIITKLELGGAQKVCLSLFKKLPTQNIQCTLLSGIHGPLVAEVKNNSKAILLPSMQREIAIKNFWKELKNFYAIYRELKTIAKKNHTIIVHTHSTKAGIIGRWAAWFARIPIRIHTIHGFAFHDHQASYVWWIYYLIERITSLITTHYVCVSSFDIRLGIKLFPKFSERHSLIRAAVAPHFFLPAKRMPSLPITEKNIHVFGTIACFKPQKNLFDLLYAFKYVYEKNPNVSLEIIGDGMLRPAIKSWIIEHKLSSAIILHGWQSEVKTIMESWQTFVLSSLWEGLPCSIVEARLLSIPIISYNTGGISDIVYSHKNGYLIPQKNWPALADRMLLISQDKKLYKKLQSYSDQLSDFSYTNMIKHHRSLYKKITN